jgi:hypothetical protein
MSDRSIRWKNFRSFSDTGWVKLRPLTVLIGPNNSGKSSLLKPLLLLKQTLAADDATDPLLLRGPLANIGSYRDAVRGHDPSREITLQLRYRGVAADDTSKPIGSLPPSGIEVSFEHDELSGQAVLSGFRVTDAADRVMLSRHARKNGTYSIRLANAPLSVSEKDAKPDAVEDARALAELMRDQLPQKFLFEPNEILIKALQRGLSAPKQGALSIPDQVAYYMAVLSTINKLTKEFLDNISYIAPLRDPFSRSYEWGGNNPSSIGIGGSRAPELIAARWNDPSFRDWVLKRLADFGFKGGLEVERAEGMPVFRLMVRSSPKSPAANIADSGFGLSQVLPFIVFGAYAKPGSLLIAEQPEIHLNPRLQLRLAHLLVAIVKQRKVNVVIETHSEHLLSELRLLVAKKRLQPADLGVLYVEKATLKSTVRDVPVEADGQVRQESWPKGFFEEPVDQALELLAMMRSPGHQEPTDGSR